MPVFALKTPARSHFAAIGSADTTWAQLVSWFPATAPLAMPNRIAMGVATWWDPLLAALLTVATIAGLVVVGGRVYTRAILHTGPTLSLGEAWRGEPILVSMGSLAHYMQEAASHGLRLDHFVHEGNGDLWMAALEAPRRHVSWVMIEERAEGGDQLAARAQSDASFLTGFVRAADGGGLVLYRRVP